VDLRDIGEFGLIHRIAGWTAQPDPALVQGIGDDVAVIGMDGKNDRCLLATTDLLIEDVDFKRSWTNPLLLGKKALAVNLSDIAAMGGTPSYFLISLGLPRKISLSFVSSFYRGLKEAAKRHGVLLVGGDLSVSQKIVINICLLGEGKRKELLFRNGAKAGDDLFVSGTLGDSALGLEILKKEGPKGKPEGLIGRHLSPVPRTELGRVISQQRLASAMIDVSDGLFLDASHLLDSSRVGARIREDCIPLSKLYRKHIRFYSKDSHRFALTGGEDYELLFTASPEKKERILSLAGALKIPITWIGKILPRKEGFRIVGLNGKEYSPPRPGFEHFK
jgi:thiamine-monophosphate kinase